VINYNQKSPDYLLEDLDHVYVDPDKRTYPLSSYSYEIIPTASNDKTMTTAKRQTLADFDYYSICAGQKEMGPIGYSPLPINLVAAGFQQIAKLHRADGGVNLTKENIRSCDNPTFVAGNPKENHLAQIAPMPLPCDKAGAGPCAQPGAPGAPPGAGDGKGGNGSSGGANSGGTNSGGTNAGGNGGSGAGSGTGGTGSGGTETGAGTGNSSKTGAIDPATGQATTTTTGTSDDAAVIGQPAEIPASQNTDLLGPLAGVLLIAILVGPPLLSRRLRSRRGGS
jgi:hypothetical protein